MTPSAPTRSRWFQFRLRTLFLVVTLLAFPLGWFSHKLRQAERQRDAVAKLRAMNLWVNYDWEYLDDGATPKEPQSTFARWVLGDDFFDRVHGVALAKGVGSPEYSRADEAEKLRLIASLTDLKEIFLDGGGKIDDQNLLQLRSLSRLESLSLKYTISEGDGLACLQGMPELKYFALSSVASNQMARLNVLSKLEVLRLADTNNQLTELENLRLPRLRELAIWRGAKQTDTTRPMRVSSFAGMPQLETVSISEFAIQPGLINALAQLPNLTRLELTGTNNDLVDLRTIGRLSHLHSLNLARLQIGDADFRSMAQMTELVELLLDSSNNDQRFATPGFRELRRALPKLQICDSMGHPVQF